MESACAQILGHTYYFHVPFKPGTGEPWGPFGWGEMKDHIFYTSGLKARWMAPVPEEDSLRGLPNLNWASDHIAIVADLEFT